MHNSKSFPVLLTFLFIFQILFGYAQTSTNSESIFAESYSKEEVISQCMFYGGDSLSGFDIGNAYDESVARGFYLIGELKNFIIQQEIEFIRTKYNLPDLQVQSVLKPPTPNSTSVANIDFENGDFTNWTGYVGYNVQNYLTLWIADSVIITNGIDQNIAVCAYHTICTPAMQPWQDTLVGIDHYSTNPVCPVAMGNHVARLGGCTQNLGWNYMGYCPDAYDPGGQPLSRGEILEYSFVVDSANALLSYSSMVLLTFGSVGHMYYEQPYFKAEVLDSVGNILAPCANIFEFVSSAGSPPGFLLSPFITFWGNEPIWYRPWKTNTVNLAPYFGTTVTIRFTAAGCAWSGHFAYAYVDVKTEPVPSIIASATLSCSNQSITLAAPFDSLYAWSGPGIVGSNTSQTITINAPGNYSVVVSSYTGCSYTLNYTVNSTTTLLNTSAIGSSLLCHGNTNGTAIVAIVSGTPPYTYSWSTGDTTQSISNISAGSYVVSVVDSNGCTSTDTVVITEPPQLTVNVAVTDASCSTCCDGSALAVASGGVGAYSWNSDCNATCAGLYTCCVTDSNSCVACDTFTISYPAIVSEVVPEGFSIHPNPTSGIFIIQTQLTSGIVEVYNILGKRVHYLPLALSSWRGDNGEARMNIYVHSGIYFVRVSDGEHVFTQKVVIE